MTKEIKILKELIKLDLNNFFSQEVGEVVDDFEVLEESNCCTVNVRKDDCFFNVQRNCKQNKGCSEVPLGFYRILEYNTSQPPVVLAKGELHKLVIQ